MGDTKIPYAKKTWNVVTGCNKISAGCRNCYAERWAIRLAGRSGYPKKNPFTVTLHKDRLQEPRKWRKPQRIFVCSMGDLFHERVLCRWLYQIYGEMNALPRHEFIVLTKRPFNLQSFLFRHSQYASSNIIHMVSCENQKMAEHRLSILTEIKFKFGYQFRIGVSVEPMLGPIDLKPWIGRLDWVICGCESGSGRRPCDPAWIKGLRDQCVAVGIPFFLKQMEIGGEIIEMPKLNGRVWDQYPRE